jgi:hypothetical protein
MHGGGLEPAAAYKDATNAAKESLVSRICDLAKYNPGLLNIVLI